MASLGALESRILVCPLERALGLSRGGYLLIIDIGLLCLLGLGRKQIFALSEYEVLYAGAHLVGTPYLYDKQKNREEEIKAIGASGGHELTYSKPPFGGRPNCPTWARALRCFAGHV